MTDDDDNDGPGLEPTSLRDPVIGSEVSGYRVTSRLGVGGMGIVYEGQQPVIGKRVAIKVLRHEVADNPEVVERLVSEARAVNKVGHRGIVDVFGFGQLPDGRQCIVMEYLDGEPLEAVLATYKKQNNRLPLKDVLVILDEVLSALSSAHTAGVIHRDLKPSNIFLCRQRDGSRYVKLLDFGIAKLGVLGHTPATRASIMLGTPAYMAPEQANGGIVGPAMDLYAIGVLAFELLTGQQPFTADSVMEMLLKHAQQPAPRVSTLNRAVPDALDALVAQLLEKKPELRPESAEAVRQRIVKLKKMFGTDAAPRNVVPLDVKATSVDPGPLSIEVKPATVEPARKDLATTQEVPPNALLSTAVVAKTKEFNSLEQRAPTAQNLAPVELAVAQSKTPFFVLGGLALAALVGVGVVLSSGGSTPTPTPPTEPLRPATQPSLQPVAQPVVVAPVDPPKPVPVEPAPIVAKPVEPPVAKPVEPAPVAKPVIVKSPTARLDAMVKKLEVKLTAAEAAGENVALLRKTLNAVKSKLSQASSLSRTDLESLEVTLLRLEEDTSSL
ncbi:MAG: serine/threonine protein kinase [Archangium sp.]|nr:serine/threonine protein kinase [Archangium sp.]